MKRSACVLVSRAMGGVWTSSVWQPAVFLSLGLPDTSSKRGLLGQLRSYVPAAAGAGASPGLHLGDAEPGRELRQQQEPAAALMLEGEAGSGPGKSYRGKCLAGASVSFPAFLCCVWFSRLRSRCCYFPYVMSGALGSLVEEHGHSMYG